MALLMFFLIGGAPPGQAASPIILSFTLDTPTYRQMEARLIAGQLRRVGVEVEVKVWNKSELNNEIKKGKRAAYLTDWGSSFFDPFDLAQPKLVTDGRGNYSYYSNPRVDDLFNLGGTSNDPQVRRKAYFDVQNIIFQQSPWIFGYIVPNMEASSIHVLDYRPSLDNRINLHDVGLTNGDTLVVGMRAGNFQSLDPADYRDRETETMIRNMFDGLVTRTQDGRVVPELAESWRRIDETTYVFTLRADTTFHNGNPVTTRDVVFTFERVLNPYALNGRASPRRSLLGPLVKVEAVDDRKVRFILGSSFPSFLQALVHFQIVPQDYIKTVGEKVFAVAPVGTGPFKYMSGQLDKEIVMERYDDYYGGSPDLPPVGPARVKRAVFRLIPGDTKRIMALLSGEVHIIQAVPLDFIETLFNDSKVLVHAVEGTRSHQIEMNNSVAPFNDIRVRKALNFAVDWDSILKIAYGDFGQRLATCFLPSGFGFNPDLKPYPFDPNKAGILLEEAGFRTKPIDVE